MRWRRKGGRLHLCLRRHRGRCWLLLDHDLCRRQQCFRGSWPFCAPPSASLSACTVTACAVPPATSADGAPASGSASDPALTAGSSAAGGSCPASHAAAAASGTGLPRHLAPWLPRPPAPCRPQPLVPCRPRRQAQPLCVGGKCAGWFQCTHPTAAAAAHARAPTASHAHMLNRWHRPHLVAAQHPPLSAPPQLYPLPFSADTHVAWRQFLDCCGTSLSRVGSGRTGRTPGAGASGAGTLRGRPRPPGSGSPVPPSLPGTTSRDGCRPCTARVPAGRGEAGGGLPRGGDRGGAHVCSLAGAQAEESAGRAAPHARRGDAPEASLLTGRGEQRATACARGGA